MIPYGKQHIDQDDINEVVEALHANHITTGSKVDEFEDSVAKFSNAKFAVAVSNGTAALHAAAFAAGIKPEDEVIVSSMTFAASANCVVYQGATPVFADVDSASLLIDPKDIKKKITPRTKAIIAVDYAGQPCNYDILKKIANEHKLILIEDASHSIGAEFKNKKVGILADLTTFSFHPVKHITTGEGGMILTNNEIYASKMRMFRNHGITTDFRQRAQIGSWFYQMENLGFNYRITDFQCALGISQLKKLPTWLKRRREIASFYDESFKETEFITPLQNNPGILNAYHLYVVKLNGIDRNKAFTALREKGIGVNVHYIPVHLHPYYRNNFATSEGLCPEAEKAFQNILSLPMYPFLTENEIEFVIKSVKELKSL